MYIKINKISVGKIKKSDHDEFYRDIELKGFGIRAQKTKIVYFAEAKVKGKLLRKTIAEVTKITPENARVEAKKLLGDMARGINVVAECKKSKLECVTLQEAFNDFLKCKQRSERTVYEYKRTVNRDLSEWLGKSLNSITREMVLRKFQSKKFPAQANCIIKILNAIYVFAIERYRYNDKAVIMENPCNIFHVVKKNPTKVRENVIDPDKLRIFWHALEITMHDSLKMQQTKILCKLCLLTGCREQEICTLKRDNVDLENKFILIQHTKNKRQHIIPYGQETEKILLELCHHKKADDYLFSANTKSKHLKDHSNYIKRLNQISNIKFCLHDLRRSFTTYGIIYLHIDSNIMSLLTNHVIQDITYKHYVTKGTKEFNELRIYVQKIENFIMQNVTFCENQVIYLDKLA